MPAADTSVKYFHSSMAGAPTITANAGTLITILDACLVNGFGLVTADSLTVAGGIATFTRGAGIGAFEPDTVILVAGATPSGLNGEKKIISTTATGVTFDATGISNQTATGTITAKLAPAGWNKPFSGTNLAAYQSADLATSSKMFLRVDDTATMHARVLGYESMQNITTGLGAFPTEVQFSGGLYWTKSQFPDSGAQATPRAWLIIATAKTIYYWNTFYTSAAKVAAQYMFGDFTSMKAGDHYACAIVGRPTSVHTDLSTGTMSQVVIDGTVAGCYAARSYTGMGGSVGMSRHGESYFTASGHSGGGNGWAAPYPEAITNNLLLSRIIARDTAVRGVFPGAYVTPHNVVATFAARDKVFGAGPSAGRKMMAVHGRGEPYLVSQIGSGVMFFDITGPWE